MRRWQSMAAAAALVAALGTSDGYAFETVAPDRVALAVRTHGGAEALAQTADGYVWLGTRDGLERLDGVRVEPIAPAEGAGPEPTIRKLYVRRDGTVLALAGEGRVDPVMPPPSGIVDWRGRSPGLYEVAGGRLRPLLPAGSLPSAWVWAIAESLEGEEPVLFLGTEAGLAEVRRGQVVRVLGAGDGLPSAFVTALAVDRAGALWIGTTAGLAVHDSGKVGVRPGPVTGPIAALAASPDGATVVVAAQALWQVDTTQREARVLDQRPGRFVAAKFGRDGTLWIGRDDHVERIRPGAPSPEPVLLRTGRVLDLLEDREGIVWVAADHGGLIQLRPTRAGAVPGFADAVPFAMLERADGSLAVTSTRGLTLVAPGGSKILRHVSLASTLQVWAARGLAETRDGRLLVASDRGMVIVDGARVSIQDHFAAPDGSLRARHPEGLLVARDGTLWVAWQDGRISRFPGGRPEGPSTELGPADGVCASHASPSLEAKNGDVYFGSHDGGITLVSHGRARCFASREGLASDRIAAIGEAPDGSILVGSLDPVGIVRRAPGSDRFVPLPRNPRTEPARAFGFAWDAEGRLWVSSDRGVFSAPWRELAAGGGRPPRWKRFGVDDGLPREECMSWFWPALVRTRDGHLFVPTFGGVGVFEPREPQWVPPPRVHIESIVVAGRPVTPAPKLALGPDEAAVEIRYSAPTFLRPSRLAFQYRLEPYERDWVDAGLERAVRYASLRPGPYTFSVRVVEETGEPIGAPVTLALTVAPHLWERPWFLVILGGLLVAAVVATHRSRVRRVAARYGAIQQERARIARDLHDGLAQGFTSIGLHLDALRVKLGGAQPAAPAELRPLAERARAVLDHCQTDARRAIWNLRAQSVSRISMAAAIERVVRKAAADSGASITFRADGPPVVGETAMHEYELPLVVQEAISNALRHGRAEHVAVVLEQAGGELRLSITDDGVGMTEPKSGGFGITGMRERVARLGGMVSIESAPGEGTEVRVTVPAPPTG